MPRVVLLGDSVFDNGAYVLGGPDVATQLRRLLPADWKVTLLALDAASIEDIPRQLTQIPADATHLVLSIGGNDALRHAELLEASIGVDVLARLADAAAAFAPRYEEMLASVHRRRLPLLVCTIYEGNMGGSLQKRAMGAVAVFNDRIQRKPLGHEHVVQFRDLRGCPRIAVQQEARRVQRHVLPGILGCERNQSPCRGRHGRVDQRLAGRRFITCRHHHHVGPERFAELCP